MKAAMSQGGVRVDLCRWWHRRWRNLWRKQTRAVLYPRLEIFAVVLTLVMGWSSYALLTGQAAPINGVAPSRSNATSTPANTTTPLTSPRSNPST